MPFFSIIIPVYNVAPYLRECLDSVLAQTFTDWEAICVDDGSTDGSGVILDEYAARDKRFRVVHQNNAGVSAARNVALDLMKGEWFLFLDGDDRFRSYALHLSAKVMSDTKADAAITSPLYYAPADNSSAYNLCSYDDICERVEIVTPKELLLGAKGVHGFTPGRVYKRLLFGHLRFDVGVKMMEDLRFWINALAIDAKWAWVPLGFAEYRTRDGSAVHSIDFGFFKSSLMTPPVILESLRSGMRLTADEIRQYWEQWGGVYEYYARRMYAHWDSFSKLEKRHLLECIREIPMSLGWYPWGIGMRVRFFSARNGLLRGIEPFIGFAEYIKGGINSRLKIMLSWKMFSRR